MRKKYLVFKTIGKIYPVLKPENHSFQNQKNHQKHAYVYTVIYTVNYILTTYKLVLQT
jgi:hypothetical protein